MSTAEIPGILPGAAQSSVALQRGKRTTQGTAVSDMNKSRIEDDRRRYQRVNVPLLGRFMRQNKEEYPCQIVNVSAGGIAVRAPVSCEIGEKIVVYLDTLGRIEGEIVRTYQEGFALKSSASNYKREKIANQLTWLLNKNRLSSIEDRRYDRIVPRKSHAKMTMPDGTSYDCHIIDVSLGGAAVSAEPKPEIGQEVTLGLIPGRVVRHGENSISIEFLEIQDPATLERQFG